MLSRKITLILILSGISLVGLYGQKVGIGTATPNNSAMLDIVSANKGLLIPRLETSAVTSPATGLLVFQPSNNTFYFYNGAAWEKLGRGVVDEDGDTRVTALNATGSVDSILFEIDNQKKLTLKRNPGGDLVVEPIGLTLNAFFGNNAGMSLTSGQFNSGFGENALKGNLHGNFNTGLGYDALAGNTSGAMNTALGASSLSQNTFGNFNTAQGVTAMQFNTTGSYNVATGHGTMTNSTGSYNTALGASALAASNSGSYNVATGHGTMNANSTGSYNTALGASALASSNTGSYNVAAGYKALNANTTASGNVAIGREALAKNTTREHLVAVGDSALHYNQQGAITSEDGILNTAVGSKAMLKNTVGKWNVAFGYQAMKANISGANNAAFGKDALHRHTSGSANTAIGTDALWGHLTGGSNTAVGTGAIGNNQTGSNNIGIGWRSGLNNFTGSNNIFIGTQAGHDEAGSNRLYIENSMANPDSAMIYGEFDSDLLRVNANMEVNVYDPGEIGVQSIIKAPTGTLNDAAGVYGENTVDDYYGIGVHGRGGYFGVVGENFGSGTSFYTGVRGIATGLSGSTTYGVYGHASGGTYNYGGFFDGNGYFSGELGIGIEDATKELHIRNGDDPTILIQSDGVDELSGRVSLRQSNFTGVDMYYDGHSSGEAMVFETFTSGTSNGRKMTVDISGNVGIGITENIASGHKLSVNGKIACTEVRVQPQSAWPDYVFAPEYDLLSLDDLQASLQINNHLPGIPSAEEIHTEGLQLGEMQSRMMEKIEEMTLYILQLNAEIKSLKQENLEQAQAIAKLK